jgi:hypothetical protein
MSEDQNPWAQMPDHRRELYFRVIDHWPDIHPITLRLHFLDNHFPLTKIDAALKWLVSNNLIGKRFVLWFQQACSNSDLEMHRILLSIVDNLDQVKIVAGKNFRS